MQTNTLYYINRKRLIGSWMNDRQKCISVKVTWYLRITLIDCFIRWMKWLYYIVPRCTMHIKQRMNVKLFPYSSHLYWIISYIYWTGQPYIYDKYISSYDPGQYNIVDTLWNLDVRVLVWKDERALSFSCCQSHCINTLLSWVRIKKIRI